MANTNARTQVYPKFKTVLHEIWELSARHVEMAGVGIKATAGTTNQDAAGKQNDGKRRETDWGVQATNLFRLQLYDLERNGTCVPCTPSSQQQISQDVTA